MHLKTFRRWHPTQLQVESNLFRLSYEEIKQMSSQDRSSLIELTASSVNNTRLTQNHLSDSQLSKLTLPAHCLTAKIKKAHVAH